MSKPVLKGCLLVLLAIFAVGCASTGDNSGGVTTRAYIADKDREDQSLQGGNQGYLMGTPKEDRGQGKKTRKVYVVEFTKELPEEEGSLIPPARPKKPYQPVAKAQPVQEPEWTKPARLPAVEAVEPVKNVSQEACQEYIVKKGDTLQKISKKFFGSYGKWGKIYEANKEKLADPDQLKAGMKLCVPGVEKAAPETENLK